jgi:SM-20-related protein
MYPYQTPIAIFEEFLAASELLSLQAFVAAHEGDFVPSMVQHDDGHGAESPEYRRSRVLFNVGEYHALLGRRIVCFLPNILYRLRLSPFWVTEFELQLTASNHGEFFRAHTDSGDGRLGARTVTYVYFCHREPRGFGGGELRIYGRDPATGANLTDVCSVIQPTQNSIVFFPSDLLHEITPVVCPTGAFADSRFTLNGWLHR